MRGLVGTLGQEGGVSARVVGGQMLSGRGSVAILCGWWRWGGAWIRELRQGRAAGQTLHGCSTS